MNKSFINYYPTFQNFKEKLNAFEPDFITDLDLKWYGILKGAYPSNYQFISDSQVQTDYEVYKNMLYFKMILIKIFEIQKEPLKKLIITNTNSSNYSGNQAPADVEKEADKVLNGGGSSTYTPAIFNIIGSAIGLPNILNELENLMDKLFSPMGNSAQSEQQKKNYVVDINTTLRALKLGVDDKLKKMVVSQIIKDDIKKEVDKFVLEHVATIKGEKGEKGEKGALGDGLPSWLKMSIGATPNVKLVSVNNELYYYFDTDKQDINYNKAVFFLGKIDVADRIDYFNSSTTYKKGFDSLSSTTIPSKKQILDKLNSLPSGGVNYWTATGSKKELIFGSREYIEININDHINYLRERWLYQQILDSNSSEWEIVNKKGLDERITDKFEFKKVGNDFELHVNKVLIWEVNNGKWYHKIPTYITSSVPFDNETNEKVLNKKQIADKLNSFPSGGNKYFKVKNGKLEMRDDNNVLIREWNEITQKSYEKFPIEILDGVNPQNPATKKQMDIAISQVNSYFINEHPKLKIEYDRKRLIQFDTSNNKLEFFWKLIIPPLEMNANNSAIISDENTPISLIELRKRIPDEFRFTWDLGFSKLKIKNDVIFQIDNHTDNLFFSKTPKILKEQKIDELNDACFLTKKTIDNMSDHQILYAKTLWQTDYWPAKSENKINAKYNAIQKYLEIFKANGSDFLWQVGEKYNFKIKLSGALTHGHIKLNLTYAEFCGIRINTLTTLGKYLGGNNDDIKTSFNLSQRVLSTLTVDYGECQNDIVWDFFVRVLEINQGNFLLEIKYDCEIWQKDNQIKISGFGRKRVLNIRLNNIDELFSFSLGNIPVPKSIGVKISKIHEWGE